MIGTPGRQIGIKSKTHHGDGICFSLLYRQFCYHGLSFCQLILSSIRHQHTARSDRRVEHFHQPLLRTHIYILQKRQPCGLHIPCLQFFPHGGHSKRIKIIFIFIRNFNFHGSLLMCSVGIQKRPFQVHDFLAPPAQYKPGVFRDCCHCYRFQVFLCGIAKKLFHILGVHYHRHAFL